MATSTEIANLALSHLGAGVTIADLDTEDSAEARACRAFYAQARQQTLRDFAWPWATKFADLGLLEEEPTDEWDYSYTYPSDCLRMRRILSGSRNDSRQTRVAYRVVYGTAGAEIYTDMEDAVVEYTQDITDTDRIPSDATMAISLRLAAYIAPRVTGGDPFKMGARAMQLYMAELAIARANAVQDEQAEEPPESEFILGRS